MTTPDFLTAVREESAAFRSALATAAPAPVPSCPDWSSDDLLWHLTEVQWFWGTIVRQDIADPEGLRHPDRPTGREALLEAFDDADRLLQESLAEVPADATRWTWTPDESLHRAGYIRRRQAHEALIHRVDAQLTAGVPLSPIDPVLASDGVDEVVEVMYGRDHPLVTFAASDGRVVELAATDTGQRWVLQLGRETGTVPETGESIDDPNFRPAPTATPVATVSGTAADLDLWLWNRPTIGELTGTGDTATLDAMDEVLAEGLQ